MSDKDPASQVDVAIQLNVITDQPPEAALAMAFLLLRGGEAKISAIEKDFRDWIERYGPPSYEKLRRWRDSLKP